MWNVQGIIFVSTRIYKEFFKSASNLKGALSGLRQILAIESLLKTMRNAFYLTSKALFVLRISKFFVSTFQPCNKTTWLER